MSLGETLQGKASGVLAALAGLGLLVYLEGVYGRFWVVKGYPGPQVAEIGYWLGQGWVQASLLTAMYLVGRTTARPPWRTLAIQGWVAFALSGLGSQAIKHLIGRPRPRLWAEGITHFGPSLASGLDSFPSGHTSTSFALATVLAWHFPRTAPLWMVLASLVAASRMVAGAHFLSDVLGGVILGLAAGWMAVHFRVRSRSGATPCLGI